MLPQRFARRAALIAAIALAAACAPKVSAENYERIQNGMTQKEVIDILGEPVETSAIGIAGISGAVASWREGGTHISVQFLNGKVQGKQLSREDARRP